MIARARRTVLLTMAATAALAGAGCPKQSPPGEGPEVVVVTPATKPSVQASAPVEPPAPQSRPAATRPAETRPAVSQPASTYDPRPPYTVRLYVRNPEDRQPGWLKILELDDREQAATALGAFPEQNEIDVTTGNVRKIQVQIGFLPLAPRKRTFLRIDKQGIEITTKGREFVVLERSPAGAWKAVPQKK
jgi:hypothetical protein